MSDELPSQRVVQIPRNDSQKQAKANGTEDESKGNAKDDLSERERHVYQIGEQFPDEESQFVEFKGMSIFHHDRLIGYLQGSPLIPEISSSFSNSQGGTLWVGVSDDSTIVGVELTKGMRDSARLAIDDAARNLKPPLKPSQYSIEFKKKSDPRRSIICITVAKSQDFHVSHNGEYLIRGAASVISLNKGAKDRSVKKKSFQCPISTCSETFPQKARLNQHLAWHRMQNARKGKYE